MKLGHYHAICVECKKTFKPNERMRPLHGFTEIDGKTFELSECDDCMVISNETNPV